MVLPSAPPRPCQNTTCFEPWPISAMPTVGVGGAAAAVGASAAGAVGAAAPPPEGAAVGAGAVVVPPQAAIAMPAPPNAIALRAARRFKRSFRLALGSVAMFVTPTGCGVAAQRGHSALWTSALRLQ